MTNWLAIIEKAQSIAPTKAHVDLLAEALKTVGTERDVALRRCNELESRLQKLESPAGMVLNMGVLWKGSSKGFEENPYCNECSHHPVMMPTPPSRPKFWMCSQGHNAPFAVRPPGKQNT